MADREVSQGGRAMRSSGDAPEAMKSHWVMAIFFTAALLAYTPGVWWGLPDGTEPGRSKPWGTDELAPLGAINELYGVLAARQPNFNPQYPLFHYICQFVFVAPYYVWLWAIGHISRPEANFPYGLDDPRFQLGVLTVLARVASLLAAAGVVAVAFRTGEVLRNRKTGILAALFVLLLYPMFYYARTSNVDMGALLWTALGLLLFAQCLVKGTTTRRWIALGICAGLATAAKDPCYAAFLPVAAVLVYLHARTTRPGGVGRVEAWRAPLYALAASLAVYVVTSGLVLSPSRYVKHFEFVTRGPERSGVHHYRPASLERYLELGQETVTQLADAMGMPMLLCALAGLVLWAMRDRRLLLWVLPAVGVFAGVVVPVRFVLLRFVLIIVYVLAFCAADVLARGLARSYPWQRRVTLAVVVGVIASGGLRGADLTYQMLHDSRYAATEWLNRVARPGDQIGHLVLPWNLPSFPPGVQRVHLGASELPALSAANGPEFIISMPLEDYEPVHERRLPEEVYQELLTGTRGYRQVALLQAPSLLRKRPATFVNPPLRIFIQEDLWQSRLGG